MKRKESWVVIASGESVRKRVVASESDAKKQKRMEEATASGSGEKRPTRQTMTWEVKGSDAKMKKRTRKTTWQVSESDEKKRAKRRKTTWQVSESDETLKQKTCRREIESDEKGKKKKSWRGSESDET